MQENYFPTENIQIKIESIEIANNQTDSLIDQINLDLNNLILNESEKSEQIKYENIFVNQQTSNKINILTQSSFNGNDQTNFSAQNSFEDIPYSQYAENKEHRSNLFLKRISQNDDLSLPILSVIVSLCSGTSYDNLFRQVQQKAPEGGRISVYSCYLDKVDLLNKYLKGEASLAAISGETLKNNVTDLIKEMEEIEPDCVLFNFECCSGCEHDGYCFPKKEETMNLVKLLLDRGNMVMFSDFAVKALIKDWAVDSLGLNPFVNLGECSTQMSLYFKPETLKECPSAQLKMVGNLSANGEVHIHALGGTIVFGIDQSKIDTSIYELNVLTIVTKAGGFDMENEKNTKLTSEINSKKGTVGHAMIKFKKNNGVILLSAGHWIELSNLNVDLSNMEKVANSIGGEYLQEMNDIKYSQEYEESEKSTRFKSLANKYVQQSAPCNYSQKANISYNMNSQNKEK